jgi:hypothetical protein
MCYQPPGTGICVTFSHLWWGDASSHVRGSHNTARAHIHLLFSLSSISPAHPNQQAFEGERRHGGRGASSPPWSGDTRAVATCALFHGAAAWGASCHRLAMARGRGGLQRARWVRRWGPAPGSGGAGVGATDLRTAARSSHVGEAGPGGGWWLVCIFFLFHFLQNL